VPERIDLLLSRWDQFLYFKLIITQIKMPHGKGLPKGTRIGKYTYTERFKHPFTTAHWLNEGSGISRSVIIHDSLNTIQKGAKENPQLADWRGQFATFGKELPPDVVKDLLNRLGVEHRFDMMHTIGPEPKGGLENREVIVPIKRR
jgi:hypothetical protein